MFLGSLREERNGSRYPVPTHEGCWVVEGGPSTWSGTLTGKAVTNVSVQRKVEESRNFLVKVQFCGRRCGDGKETGRSERLPPDVESEREYREVHPYLRRQGDGGVTHVGNLSHGSRETSPLDSWSIQGPSPGVRPLRRHLTAVDTRK